MFSFLARDIFMREFLAVMFETSKLTGIYSTLDIIFVQISPLDEYVQKLVQILQG